MADANSTPYLESCLCSPWSHLIPVKVTKVTLSSPTYRQILKKPQDLDDLSLESPALIQRVLCKDLIPSTEFTEMGPLDLLFQSILGCVYSLQRSRQVPVPEFEKCVTTL